MAIWSEILIPCYLRPHTHCHSAIAYNSRLSGGGEEGGKLGFRKQEEGGERGVDGGHKKKD